MPFVSYVVDSPERARDNGGYGRCRQTLVELRGVTGAAVGMGPPPQTRHRQGLARVTVMLIIIIIDCCRSVLTERCSKIAR